MTSRADVSGARSGGILRFRAGNRHVAIDIPHLLVLLGIEAFCLWYLRDARNASTDIENLLLIEPAAVLAFGLAVFILRDVVKVSASHVGASPRPHLSAGTMAKILGSMGMLGCYVAAMPYLGFDVATAAYVCGSLLILGERRAWVLVVTPALFSAVTIAVFKQVVSIPLPLFFGPLFFG